MRSRRSICAETSKAVIAICLAILYAGVAGGAQVSGRIEGTVVGEDGKGLAGVRVQATEAGALKRSATTDKFGRYRLMELRPGSYLTTFSLDGYFENQKTAIVPIGGTATVDIKLFRDGQGQH
jgi:hypothetical protein